MAKVKEAIVKEDDVILEVFTPEQLAELPKEVHENVVELTDKLPSKELRVLNPLVKELFELKKLKELDHIPGDKKNEKQIDANIARIVGFKKLSAEAKKAIKGPLDELGKKVIAVEKGVNEIAEKILEESKEHWTVYLTEKAEKAAIALAKTKAKAAAATKELEDLNKENVLMAAKTTLINSIKYTVPEIIETKVYAALETFGKDALSELNKEVVRYQDFDKAMEANGVNIPEALGNDVVVQADIDVAKTMYTNKINAISKIINDKIALLEANETNKTLTTKADTIQEARGLFGGFSSPSPTPQFDNFTDITPIEKEHIDNILKEDNTKKIVDLLHPNPYDFNLQYYSNERSSDGNYDVKGEVEFMVAKIKGSLRYFQDVFEATKNVPEQNVLYMNKLTATIQMFERMVNYLDPENSII